MLIEEFFDNLIVINRIERNFIKKTDNKIYNHYFKFSMLEKYLSKLIRFLFFLSLQSLMCSEDLVNNEEEKKMNENNLEE